MTFLVVLFLAACGVSAQVAPSSGAIPLPRHSLDSSISTSNPDWQFVGAAQPYNGKIALVPNIAGYTGAVWSTLPFVTDHFEIQFSFEIGNRPDEPAVTTPRHEGFALWLSPTAIKDQLASAPNIAEWDFFGHYQKFSGLGVFFSLYDRNQAYNPSISAVVGTGTKVWSFPNDVPSGAGVYWRIRNADEPMVFKLVVTSTHIIGEARFQSVPTWTQTFKLEVPTSSYHFVGLSAMSGTPGAIAGEDPNLSERITIWDIKSFNWNPKAPGEHASTNVISNVSETRSLAATTVVEESLKTLRDSFTRLLTEFTPKQDQLFAAIERVEKSVSQLASTVEALSRQLAGESHPDQKAAIHQITEELSGLKRLVANHSVSQEHVSRSLQAVHNSIQQAELPDPQKLDVLHSHLKNQMTMSWLLFAVAMLGLMITAFLAWKKVSSSHKRHIF